MSQCGAEVWRFMVVDQVDEGEGMFPMVCGIWWLEPVKKSCRERGEGCSVIGGCVVMMAFVEEGGLGGNDH